MAITGIDSNNAINTVLATNQAQKTAQNKELTEQEDTFSLSNETEKFKNIVKDYNVTSMTHKEMSDMCSELYENGLIDLKDTLTLTLDYDRLAQDIAKETGNPVSDISIGGRSYQGGENSKINFIQYLKDAVEISEKMGLEGPVEDLAFIEKVQYYQN